MTPFWRIVHSLSRNFENAKDTLTRIFVRKELQIGSNNSVSKVKLREVDASSLRVISLRMLADPLTSITRDESKNFLVDLPSSDRSIFQHFVYKIWNRNKEFSKSAQKFIRLILERLENEDITSTFCIDQSFNMKAYFYFIHLWLIHRRLITEGLAGEMVDNILFDLTWEIIQDWILLKEVAEYRFEHELRNVQGFMFGLCVKLDEACEDVDLMPAKVRDVLFLNIYGDKIDDPEVYFVEFLAKYIIRQLIHLMQIDRDHFLLGYFAWADFPIKVKLPKPKVIPPFSYQIMYGGYLPYGKWPKNIKGNLLPSIVSQATLENSERNNQKKIRS